MPNDFLAIERVYREAGLIIIIVVMIFVLRDVLMTFLTIYSLAIDEVKLNYSFLIWFKLSMA